MACPPLERWSIQWTSNMFRMGLKPPTRWFAVQKWMMGPWGNLQETPVIADETTYIYIYIHTHTHTHKTHIKTTVSCGFSCRPIHWYRWYTFIPSPAQNGWPRGGYQPAKAGACGGGLGVPGARFLRAVQNAFLGRGGGTTYPNAPCMVYLPTFVPFLG